MTEVNSNTNVNQNYTTPAANTNKETKPVSSADTQPKKDINFTPEQKDQILNNSQLSMLNGQIKSMGSNQIAWLLDRISSVRKELQLVANGQPPTNQSFSKVSKEQAQKYLGMLDIAEKMALQQQENIKQNGEPQQVGYANTGGGYVNQGQGSSGSPENDAYYQSQFAMQQEQTKRLMATYYQNQAQLAQTASMGPRFG